jgi:hypothetical protein
VTRPSGNTTGLPVRGLGTESGGSQSRTAPCKSRDAREQKSPHMGRRVTGLSKTGSVTRRPVSFHSQKFCPCWRMARINRATCTQAP